MALGPEAGTRWDPHQYLKFADHRLRPAVELLERVPLDAPAVIYDLGCGSGDVTRLIAARWPAATVYGLDNSKEMLAQALREPGRVRWIEADIQTWSPDSPPDLIYSNATLQWLDGHRSLFPRLLGSVKRGGYLAVQMPLSWGAASHRHMREALANGPDGQSLGTPALRQVAARNWVEPAALYYDLLAPEAAHIDIWETEYLQELTGEDPVLEWVKGSGLRPILNGLQDEEREIFLADYTRRLRMAYPVRADGVTLYPFRRLFIIATRR
jgi:trans-aconitate 2-methyltransferase